MSLAQFEFGQHSQNNRHAWTLKFLFRLIQKIILLICFEGFSECSTLLLCSHGIEELFLTVRQFGSNFYKVIQRVAGGKEAPWGRPQVELSVSRDHVITGIELMILYRFLPIFFQPKKAVLTEVSPKKKIDSLRFIGSLSILSNTLE